jgi:hypothetical protein
MPNAVNYNVNAQTQALKKGNFWIATGDVGKGAGYWNGISPPLSGYTIYLNKTSNGPAIYTVSNEAQLTGLTSTIAGQSLTTSGACLDWFATQTDKMILNKDYNNIVTNGLVLNLDAGFTPSYPTTGTTWYDVSPSGNNGTLINGPSFNSENYGSIVFDGVDDYVSVTKQTALVNASQFTLMASMKRRTSSSKMICYQGADAQNDVSFELWNDGAAYFEVGNNTNSYATIGNTSTDWQYLTMVFDGTQTGNSNRLKCYINGSLLSVSYNGTIPSTSGPSNSVFSIGNSQGIGGNYSDGNISQVLIYNRALSTTEVLQNYLATINPKFIFGSNLKIWYDMSLQPSEASVDNVNTIDSSNNLVTLSRVYDLSGNGKHLLQTTKVNQPTFIPNAQNGRPANYNTGGNWYDADATVMQTSSNALTSGARSFFIVLKGAANSAFSWDRDSSHPGSLQLGYSSINGWNDLTQDASVNIGGGNSTTTYVMSYLLDTNQTLLYRNGNLNRSQSSNTYTISTGINSRFGCWTTAPSASNQEGYWYEMVFLNKIPTIAEYNALVTYLGTKWGVSCGTLTNYN